MKLLPTWALLLQGAVFPSLISSLPTESRKQDGHEDWSAIQPGCTKKHLAIPGDTCYSIAKQYGITYQQFHSWNSPIVCPDTVYTGKLYCVDSITRLLSHMPAAPSTTPTPTPTLPVETATTTTEEGSTTTVIPTKMSTAKASSAPTPTSTTKEPPTTSKSQPPPDPTKYEPPPLKGDSCFRAFDHGKQNLVVSKKSSGFCDHMLKTKASGPVDDLAGIGNEVIGACADVGAVSSACYWFFNIQKRT
ncbi:hypothetical protein MKZ38_001483 [Zalerion maritima]|uniref:LysM domain-containing protein n=1 Tax=Zalerion maritima TaxID=339359 RepID=A0AAD5WV00_9PEZI|nr:hypothetical protein MKZ38_001483 [Zalerion maritima]